MEEHFTRTFKNPLLQPFQGMDSWKQRLLTKDCFNDILGQYLAKKELASALLSDRHMVIVGPPGIGKTTIAKNIAKLFPDITVSDCGFNCDPKNPICPVCKKAIDEKKKLKTKICTGHDRFIRVQGSPDLTVEDLFGDIDPSKALQFGPTSIEAFSPGKIFRANQGILFFDELNRAPEKTQNAFLQVLEEGTVTIGSYTIDIPARFIFIGTMNPEESAATEQLSTVLMDRFDVVHMQYPETEEIEHDIVTTKGHKLPVTFDDELLFLTLKFIKILRENKNLVRKPSVRASLGLYERAQANAMIASRKSVEFQDVKDAILSVLAHRIELKPSMKYLQTPEQFLSNAFKTFCQENASTESHEGGLL